MQQRQLGTTELKVSVLGLGTSTWGGTTERDDAAEQLREFVNAGGNLLDTADIYSRGRAEDIIGDLLGTVVRRDDVVLATKAARVLGNPSRDCEPTNVRR